MEEFDRLVALEDRLIGELSDLATVDGHDFGFRPIQHFRSDGRSCRILS